MEQLLYTALINKLKNGNSALLLGPEFLLAEQENTDLARVLKDYITVNDLYGADYLKDDGFFYKTGDTDNKYTEREQLALSLQTFYQNQPIHQYYSLLAELPFKVIISLSPDNYLEQAYKKINKPYELIYYQKGDFYKLNNETGSYNKIYENGYRPDEKSTLILNLLGLFDKEESLVLTYDDFFKFLAPLFNTKNLKLDIGSVLQQISSFVLLGFRYNKWYLNFIFFLLQQIQENKPTGKRAIYFTNESADNIQFYKHAFSLEFDDTDTTTSFIDKLYKRAKDDGILFRPKTTEANAERAVSRFKVLYIASNPDILNPLGSDGEYDRLYKVFEKETQYDLVQGKRANTIKDLINAINDHQPQLLVISAHGTEDNTLLFKDEQGGTTALSIQDFEMIFKNLISRSINNLQGIIFSCCQSDALAKELSTVVDYCIGMQGPIPVDATPEFMEGFFSVFVNNNRQYKDAFDNGLLLINIFTGNRREYKNLQFKPVLYSKV